MLSLTPNNLISSPHSRLVKILSQSNTIALGGTTEFYHLIQEYFSYLLSNVGMGQAYEIGIFCKLSTTTIMQSLPSDLGSPSMKSIEILSQGSPGTSKGCNSPGVATISDLHLLQVSQLNTNSITYLFSPSQWKSCLTL